MFGDGYGQRGSLLWVELVPSSVSTKESPSPLENVVVLVVLSIEKYGFDAL